MGAKSFHLSLRSHLTQAAFRIKTTIFSMIFQVIALQLAAAISAVCLPLMLLNTALPLLGFSPIIQVKGHTKDKSASNKVAVTANSSSRPHSAHRHKKHVVITAAWGEYRTDGSYEKLTDHEAGWLKLYYQRNIEFWRPYQIQPLASKSPEYQKKLNLVLTEQCARKGDMTSVAFAKFVYEQKGLPYSDNLMITGEFLQLDPPEFRL